MKLQHTVQSDRLLPALALLVLIGVVASALIQSGWALLAGRPVQEAIPVLEKPIADLGRIVGARLTAWLPETVFTTPLGDFSLKRFISYTIYEWVKLPALLFLTTYGMTLLRLRLGTRAMAKTLGRDDFIGALSGTFVGMFTPVCSCTVTNLYVGLVAGGASRKASSAFLFASPALNEFAIIFMFMAGGLLGGSLYLTLGIIASLATAYLASYLGLNPNAFVCRAAGLVAHHSPSPPGLLARAFAETLHLCRRLIVPVLLSGLLAGLLVNFNLTLIQTMQAVQFNWWGPIVGTLVGLPLDVNAAATAPILLALRPVVPLGTLISVMMATTVASLPEVTMLNRLIGRRNTARVVGWYAAYTMLIGLVINALFGFQPPG